MLKCPVDSNPGDEKSPNADESLPSQIGYKKQLSWNSSFNPRGLNVSKLKMVLASSCNNALFRSPPLGDALTCAIGMQRRVARLCFISLK
ncbi:hypothetical protein FKM82_030559 [Ascaphus truei]